MTQKRQKATQLSSILPSVLSICELAKEPMDSLPALHANHAARLRNKDPPIGTAGEAPWAELEHWHDGTGTKSSPVSYGPRFFSLGEPLPWPARDLSRLMLLNCVAECVLASPTRRYAVHGFETAVGRDLLAVGERGHTAGTGHAEWLLCSCLKLVPTQLVRSDHPGRLEPQAQMAAGWSSAGSYFGGSVS